MQKTRATIEGLMWLVAEFIRAHNAIHPTLHCKCSICELGRFALRDDLRVDPADVRGEFVRAVYRLCSWLPERHQVMGRPELPINEITFAALVKELCGLSSREAVTALRELRPKGYIGRIPSFGSILRYLKSFRFKRSVIFLITKLESVMEIEEVDKISPSLTTHLLGSQLCGILNTLLSSAMERGIEIPIPERPTVPAIIDGGVLISAINNIVPEYIPAEIREDVCQELALAVLMGEVDINELDKIVKQRMKAVRRLHPIHKGERSLSETIGDSTRTLGELISAEY
jgi:hypothetical protein